MANAKEFADELGFKGRFQVQRLVRPPAGPPLSKPNPDLIGIRCWHGPHRGRELNHRGTKQLLARPGRLLRKVPLPVEQEVARMWLLLVFQMTARWISGMAMFPD